MVTQWWSSRVKGPLAVYATGFRQHLLEQGYAPMPVSLHLGLLCDLSGWLGDRGLGPEALDAELVVTFAGERRRRTRYLSSPRGLRPLLGYLDPLSLLPVPGGWRRRGRGTAGRPPPLSARGALSGGVDDAGLPRPPSASRLSVSNRGRRPGRDHRGDLAAFITRAGVGYRPRTVNEIVVGLRSLLRFMLIPALRFVGLFGSQNGSEVEHRRRRPPPGGLLPLPPGPHHVPLVVHHVPEDHHRECLLMILTYRRPARDDLGM
jgi:hypothetical protein